MGELSLKIASTTWPGLAQIIFTCFKQILQVFSFGVLKLLSQVHFSLQRAEGPAPAPCDIFPVMAACLDTGPGGLKPLLAPGVSAAQGLSFAHEIFLLPGRISVI